MMFELRFLGDELGHAPTCGVCSMFPFRAILTMGEGRSGMDNKEIANIIAILAQLDEADRQEVFQLIRRLSAEGRAHGGQPPSGPRAEGPS